MTPVTVTSQLGESTESQGDTHSAALGNACATPWDNPATQETGK